jgi:cobalt/nickel transport system permease protein
MHIPDGYLSPATAGTLYAAAIPFWYLAIHRVRRTLTTRTVPVLALFSAFSFILMMFNIPLPGGTTGHAIGATLLAVVLGPWAAVLGITVVLGIQALFFGDGGLITLGANCLNMAIIAPLIGYFIYKVISSNSEGGSSRRLAGAIAGSYMAIVISSLFTAIELGIQPALFRALDGTPLYAPYSLEVAVTVMLVGHLLIVGPVEALVTGGVFAYLQRSHSGLINVDSSQQKEGKLWILWGALALMAIVTPIGLLTSGTAWGEWGVAELKNLGLGYIPQGLEKFAGWWPAPLPGYGFPRLGAVVGYVLSAVIGVIVISIFLWILGRWLSHIGLTRRKYPTKGNIKVKNARFISRHISGFTSSLEWVMVNEDLSKKSRGLLQRLDPRVKLISCLLFIVIVGLAQNFWVLIFVLAPVIVLCKLSDISSLMFLKRVTLFIPIFTLIIALPALFITSGNPLWQIGDKVIITVQGARTAGLLFLRVTDSLSFGMLLMLTTPWIDRKSVV